MRVAILTISDAASCGQRDDTSGAAAADWATTLGYDVTPVATRAVIEREAIGVAERLSIRATYLPTAAKEGTTFEVEIRGKRVPATVVKPPFFKDASHL